MIPKKKNHLAIVILKLKKRLTDLIVKVAFLGMCYLKINSNVSKKKIENLYYNIYFFIYILNSI